MPLRNRAALAFVVVDFLQQLKRGTGSSTEPALPAAAARRRWPILLNPHSLSIPQSPAPLSLLLSRLLLLLFFQFSRFLALLFASPLPSFSPSSLRQRQPSVFLFCFPSANERSPMPEAPSLYPLTLGPPPPPPSLSLLSLPSLLSILSLSIASALLAVPSPVAAIALLRSVSVLGSLQNQN